MKQSRNHQQPSKVENKANKPKHPRGWRLIKIILAVSRFIVKYILQEDDLGN